jgi:anthranilate/para-aminobenzoate synthase component I
MTGAPKPKAIELIREFENDRRGIYSGVLGYLGSDGSAEFGMVIRSLIFELSDDAYEVSLGIGGGITIDSDPNAELAETELKAKAFMDALGVASPWR